MAAWASRWAFSRSRFARSRSARRRWISARSFFGVTSTPVIRGWGRPRAGRSIMSTSRVEVIHELVHEPGHEADGPDRLGVGQASRPEDPDDPDRLVGPAVWG